MVQSFSGAWQAGGAAHVALLLAWAPLVEESVFRAGLQERLLRAWGAGRRPAFAASGVTALAFAGAHWAMRPSAFALATALPALVIGLVYAHTRSIGACVALHAGCNALWLLGVAWLAGAAA